MVTKSIITLLISSMIISMGCKSSFNSRRPVELSPQKNLENAHKCRDEVRKRALTNSFCMAGSRFTTDLT